MHWQEKYEELLPRFKEKDKMALSKMISLVEDNFLNSFEILTKLKNDVVQKNTYVLGITGSSGVGKSSFISCLAKPFLEKGENVGIIVVDPSSPFSGGAFLGDRVRMFELSKFHNVYIRSMASRGSSGGLCSTIFHIIDVMKSFGFDKIIIETVGAGQSETDVFYVCDSVILLLSADSGDEIQIYKAGIMEIADCYVVNKIDLKNSDKFLIYLKNFISSETSNNKKIFGVSSLENKGFEELISWIELNEKDKINSSSKENLRKKIQFKNYLLAILENYLEHYDIENKDYMSILRDIQNYFCKEVNRFENRN
ncbi:ArgK/MeaB family GTPase [Petrotoga sp. 9PWA.NaAc.5.4]|uniref:ArgK/MeaB family GTPase n=1 Tax=Petrotoga sp. 9PWA.NaAc.5.4 TaxID=1434328 RepID=UPI000CA7C6F5|nr:GTP-binding protein [Petrotoga sp. 9PWA.NaAc.5.4]PNR95349.1 transporter [Petrotoga sp. 9PWA.NaAc.5.4]